MKRTWLAVISCVVALQFIQTGAVGPNVAFANGGGFAPAGGGTGVTTPPDLPPLEAVVTPGAYTIPVEGRVENAANGSLKLIFSLFEDDVELFTETRTVTISNEQFALRLGKGINGLPPSLLAGTKRAEVRWARETAPSVVVGTQFLAAAPYAMTLSPGARIKSTSSSPALTVTNTSTGIKATASSTTGRAIVGESTSGAGNTYGVEGRAVSSSGAAGHFVNSDGDLIIGRASATGAVNFRVANNGDVYVRGTKIGQTGPKGDKGDVGSKGDRGPTGDTGAKGDDGAGAADSFCVTRNQTNCGGVCTNGSVLVASTVSPCAVSAGTGCSYQGTGGACCVCSSTR